MRLFQTGKPSFRKTLRRDVFKHRNIYILVDFLLRPALEKREETD